MSTPKWAQWWQDDLPCRFSAEEARANAAFLSEMLGEKFIRDSEHPSSQVKHPILRMWRSGGAPSFLQLNALAADLSVLRAAEGLDSIISDLKDTDQALPTWHTVHVAALLTRDPSTEFVRFFPQTDTRAPDFEIRHDGQSVMCEAKLHTISEMESSFTSYSQNLARRIESEVLYSERVHPEVTVVLKEVNALPDPEHVVNVVSDGVSRIKSEPMTHRNSVFNVFLDPPTPETKQYEWFRSVYVLCPRSEGEAKRVRHHGKKASSQLKSAIAKDAPGLLAMGVTSLQDRAGIVPVFKQQFSRGRWSGISAVLMVHAGIHLSEPMRAPVDLYCVYRNPNHPNPLPNLPMGPIGHCGLLEPHDLDQIPAYRYGFTKAPITIGSGPQGIVAPNTRTLSQDLLRD